MKIDKNTKAEIGVWAQTWYQWVEDGKRQCQKFYEKNMEKETACNNIFPSQSPSNQGEGAFGREKYFRDGDNFQGEKAPKRSIPCYGAGFTPFLTEFLTKLII